MEICAIHGIGEVAAGADLGALLAQALERNGLTPVQPGDVLIVTQKIVSKAEGRWRDLAEIVPGAEALRLAAITGKEARFVQAVLDESVAVVRAAPNVLITRHRSGAVMANAGIDRSNIGPGEGDRVLLLPRDSDAAARRIRSGLEEHLVPGTAIVIADSFGRPWRLGMMAVALGASGLPALIDRRGEQDRDGRPLEVTEVALADLVAAAAGLVMGEAAEGVPAALVRGASWPAGDTGAGALIRPIEQDLFQ